MTTEGASREDERAGMSSGGTERTDHSAGGRDTVRELNRKATPTFASKIVIWLLLGFLILAAAWVVVGTILS